MRPAVAARRGSRGIPMYRAGEWPGVRLGADLVGSALLLAPRRFVDWLHRDGLDDRVLVLRVNDEAVRAVGRVGVLNGRRRAVEEEDLPVRIDVRQRPALDRPDDVPGAA